ncbi:MAG: hypothetical protein IKU30_00780 [Clostridia bacterium]|nr:hypothetical protein [Clostridia bacterium]
MTIFDFGKGVPPCFKTEGGSLGVTKSMVKQGTGSLKWEFSLGDKLIINTDIGYKNLVPDGKDFRVYVFGVFLFGFGAQGSLHFGFMKDGKEQTGFNAELGFKKICKGIVDDFDNLPIDENLKKPRVGIVGEILVKYMPLANNHLVDLLESEGAEAVVPELMDFLNYSFFNLGYKSEFLGTGKFSAFVANSAIKLIRMVRKTALEALENSKRFEAPMPIEKVADLARPLLSIGNQYGEGWFLAGEMAELISSGVPNIVCIQPFACLPNHVVGKGVIKQLRKVYPNANVVAVDYDPGASEVNQLNRIKLMLSVAKKRLEENENS